MEEKPGSVRRWFRKWEIADAFLSLVERGWQAYVLVSTVFGFVAARLLQVTGMIPQWWPAALIITGTALFLGASLALIFSRSLIGLERRIAHRYTGSSAGFERSSSHATGTAEPVPATLRDVEADRDHLAAELERLNKELHEVRTDQDLAIALRDREITKLRARVPPEEPSPEPLSVARQMAFEDIKRAIPLLSRYKSKSGNWLEISSLSEV